MQLFSYGQTGSGYTQRAETPSSFELKEKEERVLQCLAGYPFFSVGVDTKHIEDEKQALAQPLAQALASYIDFAEKPRTCVSRTPDQAAAMPTRGLRAARLRGLRGENYPVMEGVAAPHKEKVAGACFGSWIRPPTIDMPTCYANSQNRISDRASRESTVRKTTHTELSHMKYLPI